MQWAEARTAAKIPTSTRQPPATKNYLARSVTSIEVKKPQSL